MRECILPHVGTDNVHVAIASHGLCISEMVAALLRLDPGSRRDISYAGLLNTAWTRVEVQLRVGHLLHLGSSSITIFSPTNRMDMLKV